VHASIRDSQISRRYGRTVPLAPDLLRLCDVAKFLRVTEAQARELTQREDFPPPWRLMFSGSVWRRADVDRWARRIRALHRR
jgi:predicted DNA-binding transcriptional regulator AlpA